MKTAAQTNKTATAPAVLRFKAQLVLWPESASNAGVVVLHIPPEVSQQLQGMVHVEGTMNGQGFRAALEHGQAGRVRLRVNKAMREGASAGMGDTVQLAVLGPEPKPVLPQELQAALAESDAMRELWQSMPLLGQRDWVRWIESAKQEATRERRIQRTIEQLAEGKRRPCCVNFYEYMLCRVREEGTSG